MAEFKCHVCKHRELDAYTFPCSECSVLRNGETSKYEPPEHEEGD